MGLQATSLRAPVKPLVLAVLSAAAACSPVHLAPQSEHYMLRSEYYRAMEESDKRREAEIEVIRVRTAAEKAEIEKTLAREEGRRIQIDGELGRLRKHADGLEARIAAVTAESEESAKSSRREIESLVTSVQRLEVELAAARKDIEEAKAREGRSSIVTDAVEFAAGSAEISPEMMEKIRGARTEIEKASSLSVIGYSDDIEAADPKNKKKLTSWNLGAARAAAVVDFLHREFAVEGIDISAVSRGSRDPKDLEQTPGARARNRRVEIIAVYR